MDNLKWDLKSNYILAFTVCKYGTNFDCWNRVANDLAFYIKTTPENCKKQFDTLCQKYGQNWQQQTVESLPDYVFSIIKRLYYGDLYKRMTESRELLMVMYDFIRLFRCGKITSNDINTILQDVKNSVPSDNSSEYDEQQKKIKMLERLKYHMIQQMSQTSDVQATSSSSFPVELLPPPPPFFQQQSTNTNYLSQNQSLLNDRQVPSMNNHLKSNGIELSSFPKIIQSTNLLLDEQNQLVDRKQIDIQDDIDEIELSSDDDNERHAATHTSDIDEPALNSNLADEQDESTFISDEQIETNSSSNIPILLNENHTDNSLSNPSNLLLNTSMNGSNDYTSLDSDRLQSREKQPVESESNATTPRRISVEDDEVARMDAEQIPESIPTDMTHVPLQNDNAVFVVDELLSNESINVNEQHLTSENNGLIKNKNNNSHRQAHSTSTNFRRIIQTILSNLKTAKYSPDFTKPLKSFRLSDQYYYRIKKPLDIPEIRERMNNGDYDENLLLFERDILLMLTNALLMYHRELDIHGHARYMIDYAMELFTPIDEAHIPWKSPYFNDNNGDTSSISHTDHDNDTDDDTTNTRTPSIASTSSSSIRLDLITNSLRRSRTSNHPMSKRQRKTLY